MIERLNKFSIVVSSEKLEKNSKTRSNYLDVYLENKILSGSTNIKFTIRLNILMLVSIYAFVENFNNENIVHILQSSTYARLIRFVLCNNFNRTMIAPTVE